MSTPCATVNNGRRRGSHLAATAPNRRCFPTGDRVKRRVMILYDPRNWHGLIFSLRGTVVTRVCRRVALYGSLAFALWVCHAHALELPPVDPLGHSLLGVALGLLIVF